MLPFIAERRLHTLEVIQDLTLIHANLMPGSFAMYATGYDVYFEETETFSDLQTTVATGMNATN